MSNFEFIQLQVYANKYQLPHRRNELLLAQIAQYIAMTMGGAKASPLNDYMPYRPEPEINTYDDMTPEEIRAMFDFTVST